MVRAVKVPRLVAAGAAAGALALSCTQAPRPGAGVHVIAAPDLSSPLIEEYPPAEEPRDPLKAALFERINRDRGSYHLSPVAWDERASGVADAFCAQQIREGSHGHFLMNGMPPYARMGFAGVFGLGAENSAYTFTTGSWGERAYVHLAISAHDRMMAERPPQDGHRRAILDPKATHVGLGYAGKGGAFQMSEEFFIRRLERLALSHSPGDLPVVAFEGRVRAPDRIQFVTIAREAGPAALTVEEASARTRYGYPKPAETYVPTGMNRLVIEGTVTHDVVRVRHDREFSFTFAPEGPGLFTFVFFVSPKEGEGFREAGSAAVLFQ
jgi:uncharacterized protein YkwD